mgnify:FL=1
MGLILGAIGAITAAAVSVTKALAVVGMAVEGLKVIGNAIASIAKELGIIKPDRDIEEFGDRALQAEEKGITPDKYSSFEEWVKDIEKDDWGYDPERNKDMPPEKKILKGVEVASAVVLEKFPNLPIQDFLNVAGKNPDFFTVERMDEIGKLANSDSDAFENVVNYVTGAAKDHTTVDAASDILMDIEKIIDPGLNDNDAYNRVSKFENLK